MPLTPPSAFFIAEHPALDFLNSIAAPHGVAIDFASDSMALAAWLETSGLIDGTMRRDIERRFGGRALDAVAAGDRLYLSYAASREDGERGVALEPTPLLDRLPPDGWVVRTWEREGRPPVRF